MKINIDKEDIDLIRKKFKIFYMHITKYVYKYCIHYIIDKLLLFIIYLFFLIDIMQT